MSSLTKKNNPSHVTWCASNEYVRYVIKIDISRSPSNNPFEWIAFFIFIYRSYGTAKCIIKKIYILRKKKSKQWQKRREKKCSIGKIFAQLFLWPLTKLSTYNNITPKAHWADLRNKCWWVCRLSVLEVVNDFFPFIIAPWMLREWLTCASWLMVV